MRTVGLAILLLAAPASARDPNRARPALIPVSGFVLYYDSSGPLSIRSMTRKEVPKNWIDHGPVSARACQYGLSVPISASLRPATISGASGRGGYERVLKNLRRERPEIVGLYDVKVDLHITSVLGIFRRLCTEIHARGLIAR